LPRHVSFEPLSTPLATVAFAHAHQFSVIVVTRNQQTVYPGLGKLFRPQEAWPSRQKQDSQEKAKPCDARGPREGRAQMSQAARSESRHRNFKPVQAWKKIVPSLAKALSNIVTTSAYETPQMVDVSAATCVSTAMAKRHRECCVCLF
jgi:hypothetical protein